jgi:hypothetical protein
MYHQYPLTENRFYTSTGLNPGEELTAIGWIFDDVEKAASAARSAKF